MTKPNARNLTKLLSGKIMSRDVGSILSKLFRKIVQETGEINQAEALLDTYLTNSVDESGKKKDKSAAVTAIVSEQMSWKVFMDLITNYLKVKKITIVVKLDHGADRHGNRKITVHEINAGAVGVDDNINSTENNNREKHNEISSSKLG